MYHIRTQISLTNCIGFPIYINPLVTHQGMKGPCIRRGEFRLIYRKTPYVSKNPLPAARCRYLAAPVTGNPPPVMPLPHSHQTSLSSIYHGAVPLHLPQLGGLAALPSHSSSAAAVWSHIEIQYSALISLSTISRLLFRAGSLLNQWSIVARH